MKRIFLCLVCLLMLIAFPNHNVPARDFVGFGANLPGNVTALAITDSIDIVVAAATAGDTLWLAAGTYTITDDIDIAASISIIGQGVGLTKIVTTTDSKNCFEITASDVVIQDLTIDVTADGTKGVYVNGTGGTVLSGVVIKDVAIAMNSHAGVQDAIYFADAGGEVRDVVIVGTSSNNTVEGVVMVNASTAEAATTLKCYNVNVSATAGGNNARGFYSLDSTASQDSFLYLYNCTSYATGATDHAAEAANGDAFLYAESCIFAGDNYDVINTSSGTIQLRSCTLVNKLTSGTITYSGTLAGGKVMSGAQAIVNFNYVDADIDDTVEYELTEAAGKAGWGWASCDVEASHFRFTAAGVVTLVDNTTNVTTTDNDDEKFNIFDAGTTIKFENQLGDDKQLNVNVWYVN